MFYQSRKKLPSIGYFSGRFIFLLWQMLFWRTVASKHLSENHKADSGILKSSIRESVVDTTTWFENFLACGYSGTTSLMLDSNNMIMVVGSYNDFQMLIGYWDSLGQRQWTKTIPEIEPAYSVTQLSSGDTVAVGYTTDFGAGSHDIAVTLWNTQGELLSALTFGLHGSDVAYDVAADAEGGFAVTGYMTNMLGDDITYHPFIAKFSASASLLWCKMLRAKGRGYGIQIVNSGDFLVLGYAVNSATYKNDILLSKLSTSGELLWQRSFSGMTDLVGYGMTTLSDNSTIIVGQVSYHDSICVLSVSNDGDLLYQVAIDALDDQDTNLIDNAAYAVIANPDDSFIIAGRTDLNHHGSILLLKCNKQGQLLWAKTVMNVNAGDNSVSERVDIVIGENGFFSVTGGYSVSNKKDASLVATFDADGTIDANQLDDGYKLTTITDDLEVIALPVNSSTVSTRWTNAYLYHDNITLGVNVDDVRVAHCPTNPYSIITWLALSGCLLMSAVLAFNYCRKKPLHQVYFELSKTSNPLSDRIPFGAQENSALQTVGHFAVSDSALKARTEQHIPVNNTSSSLS